MHSIEPKQNRNDIKNLVSRTGSHRHFSKVKVKFRTSVKSKPPRKESEKDSYSCGMTHTVWLMPYKCLYTSGTIHYYFAYQGMTNVQKNEFLLYFQYGILNYHLHKSDKDEHDPRFDDLKILVYIIEFI